MGVDPKNKAATQSRAEDRIVVKPSGLLPIQNNYLVKYRRIQDETRGLLKERAVREVNQFCSRSKSFTNIPKFDREIINTYGDATKRVMRKEQLCLKSNSQLSLRDPLKIQDTFLTTRREGRKSSLTQALKKIFQFDSLNHKANYNYINCDFDHDTDFRDVYGFNSLRDFPTEPDELNLQRRRISEISPVKPV